MKKTLKIVVLAALVLSMAGCNLNRTQKNTLIGAGVGGAAGGLVGGDTGSVLGGAALGGVIGSQVDKR